MLNFDLEQEDWMLEESAQTQTLMFFSQLAHL
jgi:hypothetical protein